jgi:long-chain acyl-CoA synthetase
MNQTLGDLVRRNAKNHPEKIAVVCEDTALTHKELNQRANRLANSLLAMGVEKGDRVAVLATNCLEWIEMYFGIAKTGAIADLLNFMLRPGELEYVINYTGAKVLILQSEFLEAVQSIRDNLCVEGYILLGGAAEGMTPYDGLLAQASTREPEVPISPTDDAFIYFTGGTTGKPKGVPLSHGNIIANTVNSIIEAGTKRDDSYLLTTPIFHLAAGANIFFAAYMGCKMVVCKSFDPEQALYLTQRERITNVLLVPTMVNAVLQVPSFSKYDLSSMKLITYGASPMPIEILREGLDRFPCGFMQLYGQTEAGPCMTILPPEDHHLEGEERWVKKLGSAGRPIINCKVRVVDAHGRDVGIGEVGEVIGQGDAIARGYWDRPEDTAETFRDGWLHTGDMATVDEDGYIYIVDRQKDMIISGGENIYPREIEELLYQHPAILECSVIGVPDDYWGESVRACVVLKAGRQATEEEIIRFCKDNLASYKKPKGIDFMEALPKSPQGKILKRELRSKYWEGRSRQV